MYKGTVTPKSKKYVTSDTLFYIRSTKIRIALDCIYIYRCFREVPYAHSRIRI